MSTEEERKKRLEAILFPKDKAADLYEEICWGEEDIAIGSFIVALLGALLTISLVVGIVFAII